eukprot:TRINITY_DN5987_c0_g1_i2.p1 TRINITY_DN5987_c0_g1~~TRINITY_DN5987_c0_g1_i2.p1  ORF type:complete len:107 (+),score=8.94 TRINITY_DN5987_c0_g1_i2:480-800(+)
MYIFYSMCTTSAITLVRTWYFGYHTLFQIILGALIGFVVNLSYQVIQDGYNPTDKKIDSLVFLVIVQVSGVTAQFLVNGYLPFSHIELLFLFGAWVSLYLTHNSTK